MSLSKSFNPENSGSRKRLTTSNISMLLQSGGESKRKMRNILPRCTFADQPVAWLEMFTACKPDVDIPLVTSEDSDQQDLDSTVESQSEMLTSPQVDVNEVQIVTVQEEITSVIGDLSPPQQQIIVPSNQLDIEGTNDDLTGMSQSLLGTNSAANDENDNLNQTGMGMSQSLLAANSAADNGNVGFQQEYPSQSSRLLTVQQLGVGLQQGVEIVRTTSTHYITPVSVTVETGPTITAYDMSADQPPPNQENLAPVGNVDHNNNDRYYMDYHTPTVITDNTHGSGGTYQLLQTTEEPSTSFQFEPIFTNKTVEYEMVQYEPENLQASESDAGPAALDSKKLSDNASDDPFQGLFETDDSLEGEQVAAQQPLMEMQASCSVKNVEEKPFDQEAFLNALRNVLKETNPSNDKPQTEANTEELNEEDLSAETNLWIKLLEDCVRNNVLLLDGEGGGNLDKKNELMMPSQNFMLPSDQNSLYLLATAASQQSGLILNQNEQNAPFNMFPVHDGNAPIMASNVTDTITQVSYSAQGGSNSIDKAAPTGGHGTAGYHYGQGEAMTKNKGILKDHLLREILSRPVSGKAASLVPFSIDLSEKTPKVRMEMRGDKCGELIMGQIFFRRSGARIMDMPREINLLSRMPSNENGK